jgi:hypothetical protein
MIAKPFAFLCRLALIAACGGVAYALVKLGSRLPAVGLILLAYVAWKWFPRRRGSSWSHGTATTASLVQIERAGLLSDQGLILGRVIPEKPSKWSAICGLISPRLGSEAAVRLFLGSFFGRRWYA